MTDGKASTASSEVGTTKVEMSVCCCRSVLLTARSEKLQDFEPLWVGSLEQASSPCTLPNVLAIKKTVIAEAQHLDSDSSMLGVPAHMRRLAGIRNQLKCVKSGKMSPTNAAALAANVTSNKVAGRPASFTPNA